MNVAIIPARRDSKRLPGKNIRPFFGKPIIQYTIESALISGCFERIIVSSDDPRALAIAKAQGVEAWTRDQALSSDGVPLTAVCLSVLEALPPDSVQAFCVLLATAPLRDHQDIRAAYEVFREKKAGSVMAVTHYPISPLYALRADGQERLGLVHPEIKALRSQDFPEFLADNGSMYWFDKDYFLQEKDFYGSSLLGYKMPLHRSVDIDNEQDWELAEYYYAKCVSGDK